MLVQEGSDTKTSGIFNVAVTKSVLLFGSYTWVVETRILKGLESLHNRAAHWISGRATQRKSNGIWVYPLTGEALLGAGLGTVGDYITHQQNNAAQYISAWMIYGIVVVEERMLDSPDLLCWWEQTGA